MARITKVDLENQIVELKAEIERLQLEIQKLKSEQDLKQHNERGAGRKPKFTQEEIAKAQSLKLQGLTYKKVAEEMNCSVGLVHKLLNEPHKNIKARDNS